MKYIWQHKKWPHFEYDLSGIQDLLYNYAIATGALANKVSHLPEDLKIDAIIDLMVSEAVKTSEIEGEVLNKEDVRSSIRNQLGLTKDVSVIKDPRAIGIAKLMIAVRRKYAQPLTKKELFAWHAMILPEALHDNMEIGKWRTSKDPMQIISGPIDQEKVHYVAPPSSKLTKEMKQFITWFNATDPHKKPKKYLPGPVRAAIAHLYFECIHPFADGNGRIGRAISEKALSQDVQGPVLVSLSTMIQKHKKDYYRQLSIASTGDMDITGWIEYFVKTIYDALVDSQRRINMAVRKAQFWHRCSSKLNDRQVKVLARMLKEEDGFKGGMNAQKYMTIARCSKATATRDLAELSDYGCLERLPGSGRSTSYAIKFI